MTLRQQIVQDHIDKTITKLGLTADQSFLVFAHSLLLTGVFTRLIRTTTLMADRISK